MKNLLLLFRRARVFILALGALGLVFAALSMWRSSALKADQQAEGKRQFHARIRDGVGREVQFAWLGDPPGVIRASVNSVDNFIFKRSGVKFSGTTKTRLAEMEELTLSGRTRRLSLSELNEVLTITAFERLGRLTDEEILHVDDSLRGFKSPDLPPRYQRGMINLPSRLVLISTDKFVDQVKAIRDQSNTPLGQVLKAAGHREIQTIMHGRIRALSEAVPEKFVGAWDTVNDKDGEIGITPLQAVLIIYSVASSDLLCDSEANLAKFMKGKQDGLTRHLGEKYPSPEGHLAFGANGYITSTPLDLVFDEQTVSRILDHIQERSAA